MSTTAATVDMAAQATPLVLFRIDSPDDDNLPAVLALSNTIFSVSDESSKHSSLTYWRNQLSHPSSFVLYLAPPSSQDHPVAFLFLILRTTQPPLQNGATLSLHIWLAGVLPEHRRGGCFARMIDGLDSIQQLTVCTFPDRFPSMWAWLGSRGWIQERVLDEGKVLLSRSPRSPSE